MTDKMTDQELNEWLAVNVMGWRIDFDPIKAYVNESGVYALPVNFASEEEDAHQDDWHPCTDLNQAWMCVKKIGKTGWYLMLYGTENVYTAYMRKPDKDGVIRESAMAKATDNPARAICEAVYQAWKEAGNELLANHIHNIS